MIACKSYVFVIILCMYFKIALGLTCTSAFNVIHCISYSVVCQCNSQYSWVYKIVWHVNEFYFYVLKDIIFNDFHVTVCSFFPKIYENFSRYAKFKSFENHLRRGGIIMRCPRLIMSFTYLKDLINQGYLTMRRHMLSH